MNFIAESLKRNRRHADIKCTPSEITWSYKALTIRCNTPGFKSNPVVTVDMQGFSTRLDIEESYWIAKELMSQIEMRNEGAVRFLDSGLTGVEVNQFTIGGAKKYLDLYGQPGDFVVKKTPNMHNPEAVCFLFLKAETDLEGRTRTPSELMLEHGGLSVHELDENMTYQLLFKN